MRSAPAATLGAQTPSLEHRPQRRGKQSSGPEAVALARSAGLELDPWQEYCLEGGLEELGADRWAAFEVAVVCARQNGKNTILEALELAALFLFGYKLVLHSAQQVPTAAEHFLRLSSLIQDVPELHAQVRNYYNSSGHQEIRLHDNRRLKFNARTSSALRGFTGDLIVFDEAYELPDAILGAQIPTMATKRHAQVWYMSSAAHADSSTLHRLRARAQGGKGGRLFYAEWGNEPGTVDGEEARARANPGYGIRIASEFVDDEAQAMPAAEFARERLGIPEQADTTSGVFPPGAWAGCRDGRSTIDGPEGIALDVAPGMAWASFAVAGHRADGLLHVEMIDHMAGTAWVLERARHLSDTYRLPIHLDGASPAGALIDELEAAGVRTVAVKDMGRACAAIQEKVVSGMLRHRGQPDLDAAVHGAQVRAAGDSWRWARASSYVDISPLVAVTVAAAARPDKTAAAAPNYWSAEELYAP